MLKKKLAIKIIEEGSGDVYYNTNVTLPQEIVLSLRESSENIAKDMKRAVAVKYYNVQNLLKRQKQIYV